VQPQHLDLSEVDLGQTRPQLRVLARQDRRPVSRRGLRGHVTTNAKPAIVPTVARMTNAIAQRYATRNSRRPVVVRNDNDGELL
jgi:hypothetical protein